MTSTESFGESSSVDDDLGRLRGCGLEACLWVLSLLALGYVGWAWMVSHLYQQSASNQIAASTAGPAQVAPGTPIGRLEIPRLQVSTIVAEGTSEQILQRAIGHLASSAYPGAPGNVVLAGHRDTFFRSLETAQGGDFVVLESAVGRDLYEIEWIRIVEPTTLEVTEPTAEPVLTLITCYPFRYVGSAPQRFIVRARHVSGPAQKPRSTQRESSPAS